MSDDDVFQRYSNYYDLLYRDKDYEAEAQYVARTLRGADIDIHRVLEFGCGTGKHARLLAQHCFDVFGIERSASMVEVAQRAGKGKCIQGDIRTVNVERVFDATVALFHVVSYQTSNFELLQTFGNAGRHLGPGGIFLFDVWHGPAVLTERPTVRVKRVEDDAVRLTRIAEPELDTDRGVVTVRYTMFAESKLDKSVATFQEVHRMRYLFPVEIELLADQTGFDIVRTEEFLTGLAPSSATWGVAYLLRKRS